MEPAKAEFLLPKWSAPVEVLRKRICGVLELPGSRSVLLQWVRRLLKHPENLGLVKARSTRESASCSSADFIYLFIPSLSIIDFKMASKAAYGLFKKKKRKGEW